MVEPLTIIVPGKPPSSNTAYATNIVLKKGTRIDERAVRNALLNPSTAAWRIFKMLLPRMLAMRHLTPEAEEYKRQVVAAVRDRRMQERRCAVMVYADRDWINKGKKCKCEVKAADLASWEKLLIDSIFGALMPGVQHPDKWVWDERLVKIHQPDADKHKAVVQITAVEGEYQEGLF